MKTLKQKTKLKDRTGYSSAREVTALRKRNEELETRNNKLETIIDYFGVWCRRKVIKI